MRRRRFRCRHHLVVPLGTGDERRAVVDLQQDAHRRHRGSCVRDPFAERTVEHEHLGAGIVTDVRDLRRLVPVVHVHRCGSQLEGGVGRLEVLGTVEHQLRDPCPLADATGAERRGEPGSTVVELPPRHRAFAHHDRDLFGLGIGECLPQRRPVLAQHDPPIVGRVRMVPGTVRPPFVTGQSSWRRPVTNEGVSSNWPTDGRLPAPDRSWS